MISKKKFKSFLITGVFFGYHIKKCLIQLHDPFLYENVPHHLVVINCFECLFVSKMKIEAI